MKGQVIGAPTKTVRKPSSNKPPPGGRRPNTAASSSVKPTTGETADEHIAVALHRIVCANLPNLTLVDDINNMYQQMYRKNFPRIDNGGMVNFIVTQYSHILNITNVNGQIFAGPVNPPETSAQGIIVIHRRSRSSSGSAGSASVWSSAQAVPPVTSSPPLSAPSAPPVSPRPQMNEQTLSLLSQGVRKVLTTFPGLGEADNIEELRSKISQGFFDMFKMPIALEAGKILVDPITILKKGEGTLFSKLVEEPVTGRVSVKGINKVVTPPVAAKNSGTHDPQITEGMKKLRTTLVRNLELIDSALAGYTSVADLQLCINGLGLLTDQETKFAENFQIMFPSNRPAS